MKTNVEESLLKPLFDFFGRPEWNKSGQNPKFVIDQWRASFETYYPEQLNEAAMLYIRGNKKTFPSIGEIRDLIESRNIGKRSEDLNCHPAVVENYRLFCDWYNSIMNRKKDKNDMYKHVLPFQKATIINQHIASFGRTYPDLVGQYDDRNRTICGLAFKNDWFIQCEERIKEMNEQNRKEILDWLKEKQENPPQGNSFGEIVARWCVNNMPEDVKKDMENAQS